MKSRNEYIDSQLLFNMIEEQLEQGRKASFVVTGMSMWPFLCSGRDSVIVEALKQPSKSSVPYNSRTCLKKGDIVLLKIAGGRKYLLHRITHIRKNRKEIQTTGDGNCFRDGWFPADLVIARVTEMERKGKTISVNSIFWRFLTAVWCFLYPVRPVLLRVCRNWGRSFFAVLL